MTHSRRWPILELGVLLIAAITRFWRLTYHSIWFDEAVTMQWSSSAPAWTWEKTFSLLEDKHPPVYYIALHYWRELLDQVGLDQSDFALRTFGSVLGVLTVWGLLVMVRRLSDRPTALLAALLTALSPVLVWYSQELRMFQPATTGLVWGGAALVCASQSCSGWQRLGWWLLFVLALEAALYSYLFSAFLLPAVGLSLLLLTWSQAHTAGADPAARRYFGEGFVALTVVTLLFLPLAYNAWIVNGEEGAPGQPFANFAENLWRLLRIFTLWRADWEANFILVALTLLGALVILGLLLPTPLASRGPVRLWLAFWIGLPLLIGNVLLARSDSVFAEDRYFLFLVPFVLWAIARGSMVLWARRPWLGTATGLAAVALIFGALPQVWTPALYRENWRAAAEYIADYQLASPTLPGAVVAHLDYTRRPLRWYLQRHFSDEALPLYFPFGGTLTPEQVDTVIAPPLQGIVDQGVATLWLSQSHLDGIDEGHLVERWLNANFPLVTEQYPTGIKLSGYALQSQFAELPPLPESALRPAAELAPGLTLVACELLTPIVKAQDDAMHPPSGWVHVRLWWQATGPIADDYLATAQVIGPEGIWGDRLYRENEVLRRWPTRSWSTGQIVRDEIDINLNPVTLPNVYPVVIGVMDSAGQPLTNHAECGRVQVIR